MRADVGERCGQAGAEKGEDGYENNGHERGNQAVFDCGNATGVGTELVEQQGGGGNQGQHLSVSGLLV